MEGKFIAEEGNLKGLILILEDGNEWIFGRDPELCQLIIEDPLVSRKHFICRKSDERLVIENLSPTNPIEINNEVLDSPKTLKNGDLIKVGEGLYRYYDESPAHIFENTIETSSDVSKKEENTEIIPEKTTDPLPKDESGNLEIPQEKHILDISDDSIEQIDEDAEGKSDSLFTEDPLEKAPIAEINFGVLDTGRWLLKVVSGPNNGAEFNMQTGNSYLIGTDPNTCDIVFHDTSVSRQHARLIINQDDTLTLEDLNSRNGTTIEGVPFKDKLNLQQNSVVNTGTTAFVIFDREGEMQTIISPFMPGIVKTLQADGLKEKETGQTNKQEGGQKNLISSEKEITLPPKHSARALIFIGVITALFVFIGIGTSTLFRSEPIVATKTLDATKILDDALAAFPSVKHSFNTSTGQLLLVGHVLTLSDKNELMYALQGMPFIKNLDDNGVVIDEYVWRETDQVLDKNPEWQGITVMSQTPGHFTVYGYLQTNIQFDRLTDYLNANFPYPDLLDNKVIVKEGVTYASSLILQNKGFSTITAKLDTNGNIILTGGVPKGKNSNLSEAIAKIKDIRGVRSVNNLTAAIAPEESIINVSDNYEVTGVSNQENTYSVIINGRILMKGDSLDGMMITSIKPSTILLERDQNRYKIDFNR